MTDTRTSGTHRMAAQRTPDHDTLGTAEGAPYATVRQRDARGRAARSPFGPGDHAELVLPGHRPDPVTVLEAQAASRVPELVPVRYGRMLASPLAFFRGAAAVMAGDLAVSPRSGLDVQLCGDAQLANFTVFADPGRRLIFDVDDFSETVPGPWEWDVKRLAASLVVAGRGNDFDQRTRRKTVLATVRGYQGAMAAFAGMHTLDVWYAHADVTELQHTLAGQLRHERRGVLDRALTRARGHDGLRSYGRMTALVDGQRRIGADPPFLVPVGDLHPEVDSDDLVRWGRDLLSGYRRSLPADRQVLLDRFDVVDIARAVIGVGRVGIRCWVVLLRGRDGDDPLLLQVTEAQASVLEPHLPAPGWPPSPMGNQGERVATGQQMTQAAGDVFLGWTRARSLDGARRDFHVRQLRNRKDSFPPEQMGPAGMAAYGRMCAWTLARAHARSGDAVAISAYLGEYEDAFPRALAEFGERYADRNERDHAALVAAVHEGRVQAESDL